MNYYIRESAGQSSWTHIDYKNDLQPQRTFRTAGLLTVTNNPDRLVDAGFTMVGRFRVFIRIEVQENEHGPTFRPGPCEVYMKDEDTAGHPGAADFLTNVYMLEVQEWCAVANSLSPIIRSLLSEPHLKFDFDREAWPVQDLISSDFLQVMVGTDVSTEYQLASLHFRDIDRVPGKWDISNAPLHLIRAVIDNRMGAVNP